MHLGSRNCFLMGRASHFILTESSAVCFRSSHVSRKSSGQREREENLTFKSDRFTGSCFLCSVIHLGAVQRWQILERFMLKTGLGQSSLGPHVFGELPLVPSGTLSPLVWLLDKQRSGQQVSGGLEVLSFLPSGHSLENRVHDGP